MGATRLRAWASRSTIRATSTGLNDPKSGSGSVAEFARCNGTGTLIVSGIPNAGGIVLDQSGDLYYVNQTTNGGFYSGIYQCKKISHWTFFFGWRR